MVKKKELIISSASFETGRRRKNRQEYYFWEFIGEMPNHRMEIRCRYSMACKGQEQGPYETFTEAKHSSLRYLRSITRSVVSLRFSREELKDE